MHATDGLVTVLRHAGRLTGRLTLAAAAIGAATFATGRWVIGTGPGWTVIGGIVCSAPVIAATLARGRLAAAERAARSLGDEVSHLDGAATLTVDGSTTVVIGAGLAPLDPLRERVRSRPDDYPGLVALLGTLARVPALVALAVLGTLAVGALGTLLLIGGVID